MLLRLLAESRSVCGLLFTLLAALGARSLESRDFVKFFVPCSAVEI